MLNELSGRNDSHDWDLFSNGKIRITSFHKGKARKKKKVFSKYSKVFFKYSKVNIILRHLPITYFPNDIMNQYRRYIPIKKFYNSNFFSGYNMVNHISYYPANLLSQFIRWEVFLLKCIKLTSKNIMQSHWSTICNPVFWHTGSWKVKLSL